MDKEKYAMEVSDFGGQLDDHSLAANDFYVATFAIMFNSDVERRGFIKVATSEQSFFYSAP